MTALPIQRDGVIDRLLSAAKRRPAPQPRADEKAVDYDWSSPSCFTPDQLPRLAQFAELLAGSISAALSEQLHEKLELQAGRPAQHYAGRLARSEGQTANHYFPVAVKGGGQCGFVAVPAAMALGWVARILGGQAAGEIQQRELSFLEAELLTDVVAACAEAVGRILRQAGGELLVCDRRTSAAPPLADSGPADEYCVLDFRQADGDGQPVISFALRTGVLAPAARASADQSRAEQSPQDARKVLQALVERTIVTGEVRLGLANLTVQDVMCLQEGDVLLVQTRIDEPVELVVQGKVVLSGYPVHCDGRYALQIAGVSHPAPGPGHTRTER